MIDDMIQIALLAVLVFGGLGCIGIAQDKVLHGGARKMAMSIAPIPHGIMSPSFNTLHMIAVILLVACLIGKATRRGSRKGTREDIVGGLNLAGDGAGAGAALNPELAIAAGIFKGSAQGVDAIFDWTSKPENQRRLNKWTKPIQNITGRFYDKGVVHLPKKGDKGYKLWKQRTSDCQDPEFRKLFPVLVDKHCIQSATDKTWFARP